MATHSGRTAGANGRCHLQHLVSQQPHRGGGLHAFVEEGQRPSLVYGDGQLVKVENVTEVQTFARFVAEKKGPPASRAALLDYYRQAA